MEWIKLDTKTLNAHEFIGSEPLGRATWLNLLLYCGTHENGGRIHDCASWPDRMWQQICGVTLAEIRLECRLFTWDGDDLVIAFYPEKEEKLIQSRREAGKAGADARWQKRDLPMAKKDCANTEQSRTEKRRGEKSRQEEEPKASASGRRGLDWGEVVAWMDLVNGGIPDRPRAESLSHELIDEMELCKWIVDGKAVVNPLGLLIDRLKRDGAYKTKGKR